MVDNKLIKTDKSMADLIYFKKFDTKSEYDTYIDGTPVLPNVSIVADEDVYFKDATPPPHDYSYDYLTFIMLEDGEIQANFDSILYSKDNGNTWTDVSQSSIISNLQAGDKVMFKGNVESVDTTECWFGVSAPHNVEGNILSLFYGDDFKGITSLSGITASEGAAQTLLGAPMFGWDETLISAENLFLPYEDLSENCYDGMFDGCTSLTSAPALPATTLASACYSRMFIGCTSLTSAPELPATTLTEYCYENMFYQCGSLNYIKCLATDISAEGCTDNWVNDVASTGTFVKNPNMSSWTTGASGIPTNWTIQDAS